MACSRLQAQCLVNPDSIKPILNRGVVVGYIFPKFDAQRYEQLVNELVPTLEAALTGAKQENELLTKKADLQTNVVQLLQTNETQLKSVVTKLETALDKQETIITIQQGQIRAANREKWLWRGLAGVAVAAVILK